MKIMEQKSKKSHTSKYIGINVSDDVYRGISKQAFDEGLSLSAFIRRILINQTK